MEPRINAKRLDKDRRDEVNAALANLINQMNKAHERMATDPDFLQRVQARIF